MTNKIKVYVGRTMFELVLKYRVEDNPTELCRYFPKNEEPSKTAYYLKLEFKEKEIEFLPLIDTDKSHGIRKMDSRGLEKLMLAFQKVKK